PGHIPERHGQGRWEPRLFPVPGLRRAAAWWVAPPRCQPSRHPLERRDTVDEVLGIPCPHQGPRALPPQGDMSRRHEGKTRLLLAQQPARPRLRFFFMLPALPAPPVASPDCLVKRETWAERGGGHGVGRRPAWPCASPRGPSAATDAWRVLHRSRARDRGRSPGVPLGPLAASSAPTSRKAALVGLG